MALVEQLEYGRCMCSSVQCSVLPCGTGARPAASDITSGVFNCIVCPFHFLYFSSCIDNIHTHR